MEDCLRQSISSAYGRFQELGLDYTGPNMEGTLTDFFFYSYRASNFLSNNLASNSVKDCY